MPQVVRIDLLKQQGKGKVRDRRRIVNTKDASDEDEANSRVNEVGTTSAAHCTTRSPVRGQVFPLIKRNKSKIIKLSHSFNRV